MKTCGSYERPAGATLTELLSSWRHSRLVAVTSVLKPPFVLFLQAQDSVDKNHQFQNISEQCQQEIDLRE